MNIGVLRGRSLQIAFAIAAVAALLMSVAAPFVPTRNASAAEPTPAAAACWAATGAVAPSTVSSTADTGATITGLFPRDNIANADCDLVTAGAQPNVPGTSATVPAGGIAPYWVDADDGDGVSTFFTAGAGPAEALAASGDITDGINITVTLSPNGTFTATGTSTMTLACGTPGIVETVDVIVQPGECFGITGPFNISGPGTGGVVTVNTTLDNPAVLGTTQLPQFSVTFTAGAGGAASNINLTNASGFNPISVNLPAGVAPGLGVVSTTYAVSTNDPSLAPVSGVNVRVNTTKGAVSTAPGAGAAPCSPLTAPAGTVIGSEIFVSTGTAGPGAAAFQFCGNPRADIATNPGASLGATVVTATVVSNPVLSKSDNQVISGPPAEMVLAFDPAELSSSAAVLSTTVKATLKDALGNLVGDGTPVVCSSGGIANVTVVATSGGVTTKGVATYQATVSPPINGAVSVACNVPGTSIAASQAIPVAGGDGGGTTPPPTEGCTVTPNSPFISGLNGAVVSGTCPAAEASSAIASDSGKTVQALWALSGGLYKYYLPANPGIDGGLNSFPGPVAAITAVLG